jgi:uncharacterized protein
VATDGGELPAGFLSDAPQLRGRVLFDQTWADLVFLHWPVDAAAVADLFPAGARPDVWHDGSTYVGLVPFRMSRAGFGTGHPVPFFGSFLEWNVRLYSVDAQGRHGIVFLSLDATRWPVVLGAQLAFGLPYRWAAMHRQVIDDLVVWTARRRRVRRPGSGPRSRVVVEPGPAIEPTPLEVFLTSRWGLHTAHLGRTWWIPNEHGPWPLQQARLVELDDGLVAAAGVAPAGEMLRPLVTSGVHTRFGRPRLLPR